MAGTNHSSGAGISPACEVAQNTNMCIWEKMRGAGTDKNDAAYEALMECAAMKLNQIGQPPACHIQIAELHENIGRHQKRPAIHGPGRDSAQYVPLCSIPPEA